MKCIVLAAGYATRLYPLTENFPKPLLEVNGKTILDWLLEDIDSTGMINEYAVVSNHKFADHFNRWADKLSLNAPIKVIDDGSVSNDTRFGAVRDIQFAVDAIGGDDDLLVIAGDNLLDFSLAWFIDYFMEKQATCIMRYFEPNSARCSKSGVVEIDENDRIIHMEEKPAVPGSNWCAPPFYIYKRDDVPFIKKALEENCETDAPGDFIAWLCCKTDVFAMKMPGKRFDIGSMESYQKAQEEYSGIIKV